MYCTFFLAEKKYPCSVATFSPPGKGAAILPPLVAPVLLLETLGSSSPDEGRFGCQFPRTAEIELPRAAADDTLPQDWLLAATEAAPEGVATQGGERSRSHGGESGGDGKSERRSKARSGSGRSGGDSATSGNQGRDEEREDEGKPEGEGKGEEEAAELFASVAHVSVTRDSGTGDGQQGGDLRGISSEAERTRRAVGGGEGRSGNDTGEERGGGVLSGMIAVVFRGECTFEQKVS